MDGECLSAAVDEYLDAGNPAERLAFVRLELADLEHVLGTGGHTVRLSLAAFAIDQRLKGTRILLAALGHQRISSTSARAFSRTARTRSMR